MHLQASCVFAFAWFASSQCCARLVAKMSQNDCFNKRAWKEVTLSGRFDFGPCADFSFRPVVRAFFVFGLSFVFLLFRFFPGALVSEGWLRGTVCSLSRFGVSGADGRCVRTVCC